MQAFSFDFQQNVGADILKIMGELDLQTVESMRSILPDNKSAKHPLLVIDLMEAPYIDSSGIGLLLRLSANYKETVVCGIARELRQVMYSTHGLPIYCKIYDHIDAETYLEARPDLRIMERKARRAQDVEDHYHLAEFYIHPLQEALEGSRYHSRVQNLGILSDSSMQARSLLLSTFAKLRDGNHMSERLLQRLHDALELEKDTARIQAALLLIPAMHYYDYKKPQNKFQCLHKALERKPEDAALKYLIELSNQISL